MVFGVLDQLRKCNRIFTGYNINNGMNNSITILDMIEGLQDANPDMFNTLEYLIRKWIDDENISLPTREQYNSVKV